MANKTSVPNLQFINVATKDKPVVRVLQDSLIGSGNVKLENPITDKDGNAPTLEMMLTFKNTEGKYMQATVPAGGFTDSTTITGMKRGIAKSGIDLETEVTALDINLQQGSEVVSAIPAQLFQLLYDWGRGGIASGANELIVGDEANTANKFFSFDRGVGANNVGYGVDTSGNPIIRLANGSTFIPGAGAGAISGGNGIDITASVVSVDLGVDPCLEFTGAGNDKLEVQVAANEGIEKTASGLQIDRDKVKLNEDVVVTATSSEINQALDGISANVTDTNLNTLTSGEDSIADTLHTHALPTYAEIPISDEGGTSPSSYATIAYNFSPNLNYLGIAYNTGTAIVVIVYEKQTYGFYLPKYSTNFSDFDESESGAMGIMLTNSYVYVWGKSTGTDIGMLRYDLDLTNKTTMTVSGSNQVTWLGRGAGDDDEIYILPHTGGGTTAWQKYTISGTTITNAGTTTTSPAESIAGGAVYYDGTYLYVKTAQYIKKYNTSGVRQSQVEVGGYDSICIHKRTALSFWVLRQDTNNDLLKFNVFDKI